MAAARPLVNVQTIKDEAQSESIPLPSVFTAPVRADLIHFTHYQMAKNSRQPYAVSADAGYEFAAESWGTGRAVARIPRVGGGGTGRSGQGAFGNMCRGGRMFAPTKTTRRWHVCLNVNMKRYALVSAVAATAITSLVSARGHAIDQVTEIPCVLNNAVESIQKTKEAMAVLEKIGASAEVERVKKSRSIRAGRGKMRNRRYTQRRGPLVIYENDNGITRAFRNIPGVELCQVSRLNLLQLAPGGHLGRFIIWTEAAFKKLDEIYASYVPRNIMTNADLSRLLKSEEIQKAIRAPKSRDPYFKKRRNPLKNKEFMKKLNPAYKKQLAERRKASQVEKREQ
ncbi:hypothetical protein GEMRC1_000890 [Eukaryota sp. GEM-RC1]